MISGGRTGRRAAGLSRPGLALALVAPGTCTARRHGPLPIERSLAPTVEAISYIYFYRHPIVYELWWSSQATCRANTTGITRRRHAQMLCASLPAAHCVRLAMILQAASSSLAIAHVRDRDVSWRSPALLARTYASVRTSLRIYTPAYEPSIE